MAFYVVFTTVILDWLLNLFVFLTQLPASRLAFSLTRILRAEFEQLHYNFFFLTSLTLSYKRCLSVKQEKVHVGFLHAKRDQNLNYDF